MTEEQLDDLLHDAAKSYRVPPNADFDAMWQRVEQEVFGPPLANGHGHRRAPSWRVFSVGLAASLVLGVALGRLTTREVALPETVNTVASADSSPLAPGLYAQAATELLDKTTLLLTSLPAEARGGLDDMQFTVQALELLTTTRLLLDSPAASDGRFRDLLEDLELVLAQVASLRSARGREEIELITDALLERDMVPRIRSAAARLSSGAD